MSLSRRLVALRFAAVLAVAGPPAMAADATAGLVKLNPRVFDLRTDASKVPRGPDFIP